MDFEWAKPFSSLYKVCSLFQLSELADPKRFVFRDFKGYKQEGPQCGLVALAIAQNRADKSTVERLLERAKEKGYSLSGEIFSAADMVDLAEADCINARLYEGDLDCDYIREFLLEGNLILVPYDTGKDNSPSLEKGHKAHWAVLLGAVETEDNFYVIARHGKAINLNVWPLSKLSESNSQLFEFSPDRKLDDLDYKLPEGGIAGPLGLCKKSVLLTLNKLN